MNIIPTLLGVIPRKSIIIVSILLVLIATSQLAAATPYSDGYLHGCDDGKVGYHKYLDTPGKGIDFHTSKFMQGYDTGYETCFTPSPGDGASTSESCDKLQHTIEYCNGYRAGAVQADVDDDPNENITSSKVTCQGGNPGSEYCSGYQHGYADEDHAMFSPPAY